MPLARRSFAVLLLLLVTGSLHAQLPPQAQEALDKGVLAAKQQEYALAIRYFQDARKSAPAAPLVFFNLGLAESRIAGRELRAMTWFRAYLAASPEAANAAAIKEQINALEVKDRLNLARVLTTAQQAAGQIPESQGLVDRRAEALSRVVYLLARSGDYDAALQAAGRYTYAPSRIVGYANVAVAQAKAGDRAGAESTLARAQQMIGTTVAEGAWTEPVWSAIHAAQAAIAEAQANAGDKAGARQTFSRARDGAVAIKAIDDKVSALEKIAKAQAGAGDRAGALETMSLALQTVDSIPDSASHKDWMLNQVAKAQAAVGDLAGARKTADRIKDPARREATQREISDEAKPPPVQTGGDWAGLNDTMLNERIFLDPAGYLKTLPGSASGAFNGLADAAEKILEAHEAIGRRLKLKK